MPRNISTTALQSILAEETGEVWLVTVVLDHPDMATPIRVVNNDEKIVKGGNDFLPFPFMVSIPSEIEEEMPEVQIQIDNVDRSIIEELRQLTSAPDVTMEVILASSPDTTEAGPFEFKLKGVTYDKLTIEGRLAYEQDFLNDGFPAKTFSPNTAQGMY